MAAGVPRMSPWPGTNVDGVDECPPRTGSFEASGRSTKDDPEVSAHDRNCLTMLAMTLITRGSDRLSACKSLTCSNRMR